MILIIYIVSTALSSFIFFSLKYLMLRYSSMDEDETTISIKGFILILIVIISVIATPFIVLILFPHIWLIVINGMVSGFAISDLILFKIKFES